VIDGLPGTLRAPAKLNLCLYVGPRRDDGLHEIRSLFEPLELADELRISEADADEVICEGIEGPDLTATALAAPRARLGRAAAADRGHQADPGRRRTGRWQRGRRGGAAPRHG
jgi:4-diphosphocytidyl-2-C-methyl-D-erythritol kinase